MGIYGFRVKGTRRGTKRGKETGAMFKMRPQEGGGGVQYGGLWVWDKEEGRTTDNSVLSTN